MPRKIAEVVTEAPTTLDLGKELPSSLVRGGVILTDESCGLAYFLKGNSEL